MVIRQNSDNCFDTVHATLAKGGVVILRCDTIYGIVGLYPQTAGRIAGIKGRRDSKPFISLILASSWIRRFSDYQLPDHLEALWPGPVTYIVPTRDVGTMGVRVPGDDFLLDLLKRLDSPLISTSVNRADQSPLDGIAEIIGEFENSVDLILDAGDAKNRQPSTIIDVASEPIRVVRKGAVQIPARVMKELAIREDL